MCILQLQKSQNNCQIVWKEQKQASFWSFVDGVFWEVRADIDTVDQYGTGTIKTILASHRILENNIQSMLKQNQYRK